MYFTRRRFKRTASLLGLLVVISSMFFLSLTVRQLDESLKYSRVPYDAESHHLFAIVTWDHRVPPTQPTTQHCTNRNSTLTNGPGSPTKNITTESKPTHIPLYSDEVINPHSFNFTISNSDACLRNMSNGTEIFLLILVKCRPGANFERDLIRKTWGGVSQVDGRRVLTMFLVGLSNSTIDVMIAEENKQHHDLIQANFMDTYRNLTYKTSLGFRWASKFCQGASYVASADSDLLINVHNIVRRLVNKPREQYAEGNLFAGKSPHQNRKSKWFTSKELYPEPTYPPFFQGAFYVLTTDVVVNACREFVHVRFIPWDDVYIGLVLKRVGGVHLEHAGHGPFVNIKGRDGPIVSSLVRGRVVYVDHQSNGVNPRYLKIWEEAKSRMIKGHNVMYKVKPAKVKPATVKNAADRKLRKNKYLLI